MNIAPTFIAATLSLAFAGSCVPALAQELPAAAGVVQGTVGGHAFETGGSAVTPPRTVPGGALPYDLQISLSEGRHHVDATAVKVSITGTAGQQVFSLDKAGALTDVELPPGHYHVVADFGRVKRMGSVDVEAGRLATLHLHGPAEPG